MTTLAELRQLLSEHDARTAERVGHIIDGAPGEWLTAFENLKEEGASATAAAPES